MPVPMRTSPSAANCIASARAKSLSLGDLDVAGLAGKHADLEAGPFGERGIVGEIVAAVRWRRGDARRAARGRRSSAASAPAAARCGRASCSTRPAASTVLTVSVTGSAGIAAPVLPAAAIARDTKARRWRRAAPRRGSGRCQACGRRAPRGRRARKPAGSRRRRPPAEDRDRLTCVAEDVRTSSGRMTGWTNADLGMVDECHRGVAAQHGSRHRSAGIAWADRRRPARPASGRDDDGCDFRHAVDAP